MSKPWIKQPPADLEQLGLQLGYSRKQIAKAREDVKNEEQLRRRWSKEWRELHTENPRYLDRNPAQPPTHDPSRAALRMDNEDKRRVSETELIPPAIQAQYSKEAQERFEQLHWRELQRREAHQLSNKLRNLTKRAELSGADLSAEIAQVRQVLAEAEQKMAA